ncbi:peptidylprolyl isomerase [Capsulimonas corticalis]|nr:peptidylprolyl isomerase [Capsulimonas corticalis]
MASLSAVVVAGAAIAGHFWAARHAAPARAAANPVVASVNATLLRQSDVARMSPPMDSSEAVALLVDFTLLDQAAARKHVTVSDAELTSLRGRMTDGGGEAAYADAAKKLHRNTFGLDQQLQHSQILEKLAALELSAPPDRMVHARGILIQPRGKNASSDRQARRLASQLSQRIAAGADFAALVKQYSEDAISKRNGGDLGVIQDAMPSVPRYGLDNHFTNAVMAASGAGNVANPIQGDLGYWVVQIISTARRPAQDRGLYAAQLAMWRGYWIKKLEPGVMGRLRSAATIEPPLQDAPDARASRAAALPAGPAPAGVRQSAAN